MTLTAIALTALHVTLSALVTAHVLLRKREVGSAIGWIGLAWLSPFVGSAIYVLFGVNRVRRRAGTLGRPETGHEEAARPAAAGDSLAAALDRSGQRLTRRAAAPGNAVRLLRNGDETYPRMLAAIEGATARIGLSSYIFRDDAAGAPF